MPQALHFSRKLFRTAKGPIPEDDFPRPGEDVAQRQKGESGIERSEMTGGVSHTLLPLCSFFFLSSTQQFVQL